MTRISDGSHKEDDEMNLIELILMYHKTLHNSGRADADDDLRRLGVDPVLQHAIQVCFTDAGEALNGFGEVEMYMFEL